MRKKKKKKKNLFYVGGKTFLNFAKVLFSTDTTPFINYATFLFAITPQTVTLAGVFEKKVSKQKLTLNRWCWW